MSVYVPFSLFPEEEDSDLELTSLTSISSKPWKTRNIPLAQEIKSDRSSEVLMELE